jgi:hypothetical protein
MSEYETGKMKQVWHVICQCTREKIVYDSNRVLAANELYQCGWTHFGDIWLCDRCTEFNTNNLVKKTQNTTQAEDKIKLLYTVSQSQINTGKDYLQLFMRHAWMVKGDYTYTIEEDGKYIVVHCPETGDMCHLVNHPSIIEEMQKYNILPHQHTMFKGDE